jgi:hypothetical protein
MKAEQARMASEDTEHIRREGFKDISGLRGWLALLFGQLLSRLLTGAAGPSSKENRLDFSKHREATAPVSLTGGTRRMAEMRQEITHTQEQLRQKCEVLHGEVRSVVKQAQDAVLERVQIPQRVYDVGSYLRRHVILSCLAAAAVGYLIGRRRQRRSQERDLVKPRDFAEQSQPKQSASQTAPSLRAFVIMKGVGLLSDILRSRLS